MKKIFMIIVIFSTLFVSCKKETLQTYLVDIQDKPNFVTLDFSTSMLPLKLIEEAPKEDIKTLKSVRKVNVAFLQKSKATLVEITTEKKKLETILSKSDYKTLMRFNDKGAMGKIYYLGSPNAIDEIVAFGYSDELGVGVARLLGKNMNPNAIIKMMRSIQPNTDSNKFKKIKEILQNAKSIEKKEKNS